MISGRHKYEAAGRLSAHGQVPVTYDIQRFTRFVPSPISCSWALAAKASSLAAGCSTSSSLMIVDASPVTISFSKWLMTILFIPAIRPLLACLLLKGNFSLWDCIKDTLRPHGRPSEGGQLLAGFDVLEDGLLQMFVALFEHRGQTIWHASRHCDRLSGVKESLLTQTLGTAKSLQAFLPGGIPPFNASHVTHLSWPSFLPETAQSKTRTQGASSCITNRPLSSIGEHAIENLCRKLQIGDKCLREMR